MSETVFTESERSLLQNILMIRHVYAHHSKLGGSGVLCDYLPGVEMAATEWPWGAAPEGSRRWKVGRRLFDLGIMAKAKHYRLVHFIHAEFHPRFTFKTLRKLAPTTRLLGTIHLPIDYYSQENSIAAYSHLHGIIALAKWQVDQVQELLPHVRARWVPCGFDMAHPFRGQPPEMPDTFNVITIGSNYRDWNIQENILDLAQVRHPEWRFHMVGLPARQKQLYATRPNVVIHARLSDMSYLSLIESCHTLLLPLTFATNNTAVLEAYSVGTPTLASNFPAIHDYAISTTRTFDKAEEAMAVLEDRSTWSREEWRAARKATRDEGRRFDWRNIAVDALNVYKELLHER